MKTTTTIDAPLPDLYWPWKGRELTGHLANAVMLKRGHGTSTEAAYVAQLCSLLPVTAIDEHGNIHIDTRTAPEHRTLLTAHTDTVHRTGGTNAVKVDRTSEPGQEIWRASGDALGADDGAGIALICHLIANGFKGYAVLFRAEEQGGIGSKGLAESQPDLLKEFDRAVAFDRAGYYDVITHQAGGRCCSDTFAQALADQINGAGDFMFCPDDGGVYTDTAEFTHLIPECTNLSVGYFQQHGDGEFVNVTFLRKLADALCKVQWDSLPVERSAGHYGAEPDRYNIKDYPGKSDYFYSALSSAFDGDFSNLVESMAELAGELYMFDVREARGYIKVGALTDEVLERALVEYEDGCPADDVLLFLYDETTK